MTVSNPVEPVQRTPEATVSDARQRALALGLEFTKRCFESRTLEDFFFLLTNDVRVLIEFDRSVLIAHVGGESRFVASANHPMVEKRSRFYELLTEMSGPLRDLKKGLLLSERTGTEGLSAEDLSEEAKSALQAYLSFASCSFLLCVPLRHNEMTLGHLLFEFLGDSPPDQISVLTVLNLAPFLAAGLAEKWLLFKEPRLASLIDPDVSEDTRKAWLRKHSRGLAAGLVALILVFFVIPFPFDVGGEAEVVAKDRHAAFFKIDGLLDRVRVAEGASVGKDQVLANLDPRELDYKIRTAATQFEVLNKEMLLLRDSAGEDPSKLAESNIVELKRNVAWEELDFYNWQKQFLDITAPVDGVILTRDIESLAGKKFRAGEPFCEIVAPGDLAVDVYVPEDRISYVAKDQPVTIFLAGNPRIGYEVQVNEIAPIAEATMRLGNIYRVRAYFPSAPASIMVGMKGIGRIHVKSSSLWSIISDRLIARWNRLMLYL